MSFSLSCLSPHHPLYSQTPLHDLWSGRDFEKQKQKQKAATHSFTTFSTTAAIFPVPLPQAGRPPELATRRR